MVLSGVDVSGLMESVGITSGPWLNPTSGTFVVAYAMHKVHHHDGNPDDCSVLTFSPQYFFCSLNACTAGDGADPRGHHRGHHARCCQEPQGAGHPQGLIFRDPVVYSRTCVAVLGQCAENAPKTELFTRASISFPSVLPAFLLPGTATSALDAMNESTFTSDSHC